MLVFIFICFYLLSTGWLIGNTILNLMTSSLSRTGDRIIISTYLGILIYCVIFLTISIFMPLSYQVGSFLSLTSFALLLFPSNRRELQIILATSTKKNLVAIFILVLAVALYSTQFVSLIDTGLYHYGIVQWLSEAGIPSGLALIHNRFGFTSSWFALTAPINHGILNGRISTVANCSILFVVLLHFVISLSRISQQRFNSADLFFVLCLPMTITIPLLKKMPVSLSPDFPAIVFTIIIGWLFLLISEPKSQSTSKSITIPQNYINFIPVILGSGALSIKLSALPLTVISLFFCWHKENYRAKKILFSFLIVLLFLTPVMLAGAKASGCPLYPLPLCLDLPWSLGSGNARTMSTVIEQWARWLGPTPADMPSWYWFFYWLKGASVTKVAAFLMLLSFLSVIFIVKSKKYQCNTGIKWVIGLGTIGILFLLFKAPSPRFGWGYLTVIPSLSLLLVAKDKLRGPWLHPFSNYIIISLTISLLLFATTFLKIDVEKDLYKAIESGGVVIPKENRFLLPPKIVSFQMNKSTGGKSNSFEISNMELISAQVNEIKYVIPKYLRLCWDAPIPCAPHKINGVKFRNPKQGVAAGFIKAKPD